MKLFHSMINFINKNAKLLAAIILATLFLYFLRLGPIMSMDSQSYIQKELIRSPLYPLFINGIEIIFGKGNTIFLVIFQLLFGFFSCYRMAAFIQKAYNLNGIFFLIILSLLLSPYAFYFGNTILSEGLAYPLFLLTVQLLLQALLYKKFRAYGYAIFFLTLLVLTRRQYLFLYVVSFLVCLYLWYYVEKKRLLAKLSLLFILVSSIGVTDILERSHHYYYNGYFTTVPFVGMQIMAMPLYLSSDKDASLFTDPTEIKVFTETKRIMKENKYDSTTLWKENEGPEYCHYYMNYNNVTWGSLYQALLKNNIKNWVEIDKILIHMTGPLFLQHWQRITSLYLRNIIHSMGGYYNFIFIFFAFCCSAYFHYLKKDPLSLGVFLAILISYGNYFSVAIVEPAMTRYTFSTNIILTCMLIVTVYYAFRNYHQTHKIHS